MPDMGLQHLRYIFVAQLEEKKPLELSIRQELMLML
jgi:hypothetical protein